MTYYYSRGLGSEVRAGIDCDVDQNSGGPSLVLSLGVVDRSLFPALLPPAVYCIWGGWIE